MTAGPAVVGLRAGGAALPAELRQRAQWLLAGPDEHGAPKRPKSVNAQGGLYDGDSTDPRTWLPFDVACGWAAHYGYGVGYVVAATDPYCCIDLDVKNKHNAPDKPELWTDAQTLQGYWQFAQQMASYTERSVSGQGLHIWVRGKIGPGIKRQGVELYSQERFLVCTGDVVLNLPIEDRQLQVLKLAAEMREAAGTARGDIDELDQEQRDSDEVVLRRAAEAYNSAKFNELYAGEWEGLGFPSQSEADMALMSMFTFYSRNNEQCRRLFRGSALGKRDKASKNDRYLDLTLGVIRARQAKADAEEAEKLELSRQLAATLRAPPVAALEPAVPPLAPAAVLDTEQRALTTLALQPMVAPGSELPWPPGLAGAIAGYIYRSSPRPVKEVAIVAALGWLAGVCGKSWVIPNSGLNLYIILVARSAIGKEAMHSGIASLTEAMRRKVPGAQTFVDFTDYVSGPALVKACSKNPSFLNVSGEWGRKLRGIAEDREGHHSSLRTVMTNLYQKSGPTSVVGGLGYSDKEKDVKSVSGVAYSMIGETTPGTFYDSLTEGMMADGFLSRFTVIEYNGPRPPSNPALATEPEPALVDACCGLVVQSMTLRDKFSTTPVLRDVEAQVMLEEFDRVCDEQINANQDEGWRQMWNRAHLKACRIAGCLAVADNPLHPVISAVHAGWALELVQRDIAVMRRKMDAGDVGTGDDVRERKIRSLLYEFISEGVPPGYGIPAVDAMQRDGVVPRKYLQIRTARLAAFSQHRFGATRALDDCIRSLTDSGYIAEVARDRLKELYGASGKCYAVLSKD